MARKPKQVQDAIDEAKKLEALVFGKTDDTSIPNPDVVVEPPPIEIITETPAVVEAEPEPIPAPVINEGNTETWQNRFSVLKGKYDSEVPRLHDKISMLEQMMANITAPKAEPVVEKPVAAPQKRVSKETYDEFVRDFPVYYDMILDEVDARLADTGKVKEELDQVKKYQAKSETDKLYDALEKEVPDYNAVNQNPNFAEWLNEKDGYSNRTKYDLLLDAYNSFDSKRVIRFFNDFKKTVEPVQVAKPDLTKHVVPSGSRSGSSGSGATPAVEGKIKQSTITKYYQDLALRKIFPKPAEKEAQEKAFHKAMLEGRVIYDQ